MESTVAYLSKLFFDPEEDKNEVHATTSPKQQQRDIRSRQQQLDGTTSSQPPASAAEAVSPSLFCFDQDDLEIGVQDVFRMTTSTADNRNDVTLCPDDVVAPTDAGNSPWGMNWSRTFIGNVFLLRKTTIHHKLSDEVAGKKHHPSKDLRDDSDTSSASDSRSSSSDGGIVSPKRGRSRAREPFNDDKVKHIQLFSHGVAWTVIGVLFSWIGFAFAYLTRESTQFVTLSDPLYVDIGWEEVTEVGMINLKLCYNETITGMEGCSIHKLTSDEVDDVMFQISRSMAFLAVAFGGFVSVFLTCAIFWYTINLRPVGFGYLITYFLQSLTFLFFDASLCSTHHCSISTGGKYSIAASACWIIACVAAARMDSFKFQQKVLRARSRSRSRSSSPQKVPRKTLHRRTTDGTVPESEDSDSPRMMLGEDSPRGGASKTKRSSRKFQGRRFASNGCEIIQGIQDEVAARLWAARTPMTGASSTAAASRQASSSKSPSGKKRKPNLTVDVSNLDDSDVVSTGSTILPSPPDRFIRSPSSSPQRPIRSTSLTKQGRAIRSTSLPRSAAFTSVPPLSTDLGTITRLDNTGYLIHEQRSNRRSPIKSRTLSGLSKSHARHPSLEERGREGTARKSTIDQELFQIDYAASRSTSRGGEGSSPKAGRDSPKSTAVVRDVSHPRSHRSPSPTISRRLPPSGLPSQSPSGSQKQRSTSTGRAGVNTRRTTPSPKKRSQGEVKKTPTHQRPNTMSSNNQRSDPNMEMISPKVFTFSDDAATVRSPPRPGSRPTSSTRPTRSLSAGRERAHRPSRTRPLEAETGTSRQHRSATTTTSSNVMTTTTKEPVVEKMSTPSRSTSLPSRKYDL